MFEKWHKRPSKYYKRYKQIEFMENLISENPEEKKPDESKEPNDTANGPPGGPPINRHSKPNTVSGGTNFDDLHGQQSMNVRVRDINDMSMVN